MALNFQVRAVALSFPVLGTASKSSLWSPREHVATSTMEVITLLQDHFPSPTRLEAPQEEPVKVWVFLNT